MLYATLRSHSPAEFYQEELPSACDDVETELISL